jgi:hypothetical protein
VFPLAETQPSSFADSIRDARQHFEQELRAQAERFEKLHTDFIELRKLHENTEQESARQWDDLAQAGELALTQAAEAAAAEATESAEAKAAELAAQAAEAAAAKATELAEAKAAALAAQVAAAQVSPEQVLDGVLGALRNLMTCTIPEQVLEGLTEESAQWGVRTAIFDVRGKSAWGASAHGFGPSLTEKVLRGLIVPLNQDNPFRQVCESAGHVDANAATLKKNRNVLDKLKPPSGAPVLLVPIRSGGTVSAILYADPGEKSDPLPVNALKILAEFAGAQIDRLIALSGGFSNEATEQAVAEVEEPAQEAEAAEPAPAEVRPEERAESASAEPAVEPQVVEAPEAEAPAEAAAPETPAPAPESPALPVELTVEAPTAVAPTAETEPAPQVVEPPVEVVPPPAAVEPPPPVVATEDVPPPAAAGFDVSQLSESEQKVHKDAKRFAKLLVSEIELYNKIKVSDGRKNRDLYKRLKSDIDRSRQTFEKRFGKTLPKQVDYFHDELVKTLAANDSSALGPEYPGPSA